MKTSESGFHISLNLESHPSATSPNSPYCSHINSFHPVIKVRAVQNIKPAVELLTQSFHPVIKVRAVQRTLAGCCFASEISAVCGAPSK
jgi:hypothetical protein